MNNEVVINKAVEVGGGVPHVFFCCGVVVVLLILAITVRKLWIKQKRAACPHKKVTSVISRNATFEIDHIKCMKCGQIFKGIYYKTESIFDKLEKK